MRQIELSNGKVLSVRPLTGKDVRELLAIPQDEAFTQVFEALKRAGFPPSVTDDMPFPDILAINRAIIAETYGTEEERKN